MGDWSDVPVSLRIKIQMVKFVFYVLGVGFRSMLFFLAVASIGLIQYRHFSGILGLVLSVFLMWSDAQEVDDPKDWLRPDQHILK